MDNVMEKVAGLVLGVPIFLVGLAGTAAGLAGSEQGGERVLAASTGTWGLVFGVGLLSWALPARWGATPWLWRRLGWSTALVLLMNGIVLVLESAAAEATTSGRLHSQADVVVLGAVLMCAGASAGAAWWWVCVRSPG